MPEDELDTGDGEPSVRELSDIVSGLREALGDCSLDTSAAELPQRKNILVLTGAVTLAGLDGEAFVRYGCTQDVAVPLAIALAIDAIEGPSPKGREWSSALGIDSALASRCGERGRPDIGGMISAVLPVVRRWVYTAPFTDIVSLTPPSLEVQKSIKECPAPPRDVCEQYHWVADRLGGQHVSEWAVQSLRLEYLWKHGQVAANLPAEVLCDIGIPAEQIAVQLTDRHLLHGASMAGRPRVARQVDERAKAYLHDHRYTDAAALFEFLGGAKMLSEVDCTNNRGFCLIPAEPERALHLLQRAARAGYTPLAVNVYNQMCCMISLGNAPGVRAVSERYWLEQFENKPVAATLWVRDEDGWVLQATADARERVASLALEHAAREGWPDRVARWSMRLDALRSGQHTI